MVAERAVDMHGEVSCLWPRKCRQAARKPALLGPHARPNFIGSR